MFQKTSDSETVTKSTTDDVAETYKSFLSKAEDRQKGFHGMVKHIFVQNQVAEEFALWLKRQPKLKTKQIEKCAVAKEAISNQTRYVVRLTLEQLEALVGAAAETQLSQSSASAYARNSSLDRAEDIQSPDLSVKDSAPSIKTAGPYHTMHSKESNALISSTPVFNSSKDFRHAAKNLDSKSFQALLTKASPKEINEKISAQLFFDLATFVNFNSTGFHVAARYRDSATFQELLHMLRPETLVRLLMTRDNEGYSGFHVAAVNQDSAAFQLLLDILTPQTIEMITRKRWYIRPWADVFDRGISGFHLVVIYQAAAFELLLSRISPEVLDEALLSEDDSGWLSGHGGTGFCNAAYHLNHDAFKSLVIKAGGTAIGSAYWIELIKPGLNLVHHRQMVNLFLLWNKLDDIFYQKLATLSPDHPPLKAVLKALITNINNTDFWFDQIKSQQLLKILTSLPNQLRSKICNILCDNYFEGQTLPNHRTFIEWLENCLSISNLPNDKTHKLACFLEAVKIIPANHKDKLNKEDQATDTPDLEKLWQSGIVSWHEYRALRLLNVPKINTILDQLSMSSMLFTGGGTKFIHTAIDQISLLHQGDGLIKIIKEKDWPMFLESLTNFAHPREPLRQIVENPTHKFDHSTNIITVYVKPDKTGKPYHSTRKTACTLISPLLLTPLFGYHDSNRLLVGVLLDAKQCQIKIMLSRDKGTYGHKWLGPENQVNSYKESVKDCNFTDWDSFKEEILNSELTINEVLARLKHASLAAIIIGYDCDAARRLAIKYAKDVQDTLNVTLPILFYNFEQRKVSEYTQTMQEEDGISSRIGTRYNLQKEIKIKLRLLQVFEKIKSQQDSIPLSASQEFFNKIRRPNNTTDINKILSSIEKARNADKENYTKSKYTWSAAEAELLNIPTYSKLLAEILENDKVKTSKIYTNENDTINPASSNITSSTPRI